MAQPPAYNRQKDFTENFGNETDHSSLNAELDAASNSVNAIRVNLALLQADDGKLRPSSVTIDSLDPELVNDLTNDVVPLSQAAADEAEAARDIAVAAAATATNAADDVQDTINNNYVAVVGAALAGTGFSYDLGDFAEADEDVPYTDPAPILTVADNIADINAVADGMDDVSAIAASLETLLYGRGWNFGAVDPTTEGVDGNYYLNSVTFEVWAKAAGTWSLVGSLKGADGTDGDDGAPGTNGVGISNIERTSGDGSPGTTDTYTITLSNSATETFSVYNGADGGGDMLKEDYDSDDDGKVDAAEVADAVPWSGVTDKPTTFDPSTHTHANVDFTADTKDPTGFVDRTSSTLSFNDATRELTITGAHSVYIFGAKTSKPTASIAIANTVGLHYIYYASNGTLTTSMTFWDLSITVPIATVYWNGTTGLIGDERHGISMPWSVHKYLHQAFGARYISGLTGAFTDTTFTVSAGKYLDEDDDIDIVDQTQCRVLYKNGSANFTFTAKQNAYYYESGGNVYYNNGNTLTAVSNNNYVAYWIFATNDPNCPIYAIMGQRQDATVANARTNNTFESLSLGTLPFAEMPLLYRVILRNDGTPYVEAADYRTSKLVAGSNVVATSHNSLTGLSDPDVHPASSITTTPSGNLSGLTAAAQLVELDTEKQATLVSGTNIKTVNSTTLLGSGDVAVQPTLVSGTNIKTINSTTLLGSGDIAISGGVARVEVLAFTAASSTWTKDANLLFVVVEVIGGGGGADEDSTTGVCGGSGGYSRKYIAAATLGATETVTRGAAGNTASTSTDGGTSSFGTHCSATGGGKGSATVPGNAGAGSGGDVNSTNNTDSLGSGTYGFGCGGSMPGGSNATAGVVIVTEYYSA
jgi:hypothetical protein